MRRLLFAAALIAPGIAGAYTQSHTQAGVPFRWLVPHAAVVRDPTASSQQLSDEEVAAALEGALSAWNGADARVALEQGQPGAQPAGTPAGCYLRFVHGQWSGPSDQLAVTQLWAHTDTGEIVGAVIEVNEANQHFAVDHSPDRADLQSVLTHEVGHLLGLGHSTDLSATMFPQTITGHIEERTLAPDDLAGVHAVYDSVGSPTVDTRVGCSTTPGRQPPPLALAFILIGLVVARVRVRS